MRIDVLDYYTKEDWLLMKQEADRHPTPFLVVNLNIIKRNYEELLAHFPFAKIYYAVKANPAIEVLELLRDLGSHFDIASRYELDRVLSLGISPDRISYGIRSRRPRISVTSMKRASPFSQPTAKRTCATLRRRRRAPGSSAGF